MSMGVPIRDFLKRRRERAVGTILGYAERELWPSLPEAKRKELRAVVLDAINGYHDSVLDLVNAEDGMRNDRAIELLEQLDRHFRQAKVSP